MGTGPDHARLAGGKGGAEAKQAMTGTPRVPFPPSPQVELLREEVRPPRVEAGDAS